MKVAIPTAFDTFDRWIETRWKPLHSSRAADKLFYAASEVGDFGMLWMLIAAIPALSGKPTAGRQLYRLTGTLAFESLIVNQGLKRLFKRDRPNWQQARPRDVRKPSTSSFPSGHSTSAMTAAVLLSETRILPKPIVLTLAGVVAASRVHVKIHHPSDVIGGLTVGALIGWAIRRVYPVRASAR